MNKREILKESMSEKYCGKTRFDFLDHEEIPLIYNAMQVYSDQENKKLIDACKWAIEQFKRLADEGRYPEFMLAKNGGVGIMPLVKAIENVVEQPDLHSESVNIGGYRISTTNQTPNT